MEVEYMTISASGINSVPDEFDKRLNSAVSDGWTPHGNLVASACSTGGSFGGTKVFMFQVMSRFKGKRSE